MKHLGFIVVLAGPTGVGETTVTNFVLKHLKGAKRLITTTSRPKRPGEKQGREYYFITKKEFENRIRKGFFLEYIHIRNRDVYYGTHRPTIERALRRGTILIANLELKGMRIMQQHYPSTYTLFLMPESLEQIRRRKLKQHPTITKRELTQRLANARAEIREAKYYDTVVMNKEGRLKKNVQMIVQFIRQHQKKLQDG